MKGKRIGLATGPLSPANGGVFEAVVAQAALLAGLGVEPVVIGMRDDGDGRDRFDCEVAALDPHGPLQLSYSDAWSHALDHARLDCLHLHGIWHYPVHAAGRWASETGRPLIVSPHGMMDPWITRRGRAKKAIARMVWERRGWRAAHAFHALTQDEADDIEREVGDMQTVVIPNPAPPVEERRETMPGAHVVYLGRIHPKKNVELLVRAWTLASRHLPPDARLTIAGWGARPHVASLERALADAPATVRFVGPVHGRPKRDLLRSARALVLPSASEGLPMVLLEAWAAGVPTIQTPACHCPEAVAAGAAWEVKADVAPLAKVLRAAMLCDDTQWFAMSEAARVLAASRFARETVAARWHVAYSDLLGGTG